MPKWPILPSYAFRSAAALVLCAAFAACGGGSTSNPFLAAGPPTDDQPAPSTADASVRIPLAASGTSAVLPSVAGYDENIAIPSNNAPSGSTLSVTVSLSARTLPAPAPALTAATTMLYFTATSAHTISLQGNPSFTITVPTSVQLTGSSHIQLGAYDPATGWSSLGTGTISNRTITFAYASGARTLNAGTVYGFVIYSSTELAGCPTPPPPTPTPLPSPTATPSATPSPTPTPTPRPTSTPTPRPTPTPTPTPTPVPSSTPKPQSLYVSNVNGNPGDQHNYINNVLVFAPGSKGNVAPARKVNVPGTGCNGGGGITGIALDSSGNLYVGDDTECLGNGTGGTWVRVYGPTASGNAAWMRQISVNLPTGLAIDSFDNLFVGNGTASSNAVSVYAKGASAPSRTITGSNTAFSNNGIMGVAVDSIANTLGVAVNNYNSCNGQYILVFPATANGNATPSRNLGQPCSPNVPYGAAFDKSGNLYIAGTNNNEIFIYSPSAPNSSPPTRLIGGSNTQLNGPTGIVFDNKGDLFVANQGSNAITEYAPGASGNAAPISVISGSNTGIVTPTYLAIGP